MTDQRPKPTTVPPSFVIVWDTELVSEDDYARLVTALGDLVRASGGLGVERLRSRGIRVLNKTEEPTP